MWFHRKSTAFQQAIGSLETRLEAFERRLDNQLTQNRTDLLEFAELSEKTRRLYLRLTRRAKIDQDQSSNDVDPAGQIEQPQLSARDIRDQINAKLGV